MKADPSAQLRLLDVQGLDSAIASLRHRLRSLPVHAELAEAARLRGSLQDQVRDAAVLVEDLTREQRRADADVEQVRGRRDRDQARMDSGQIGAKDLERIQHEMVSLQRRITELEDVELEVMERLEAATDMHADLQRQIAEVQERGAALQASRDEQTAELTTELEGVLGHRETTAGALPADLLDAYEKSRERHGGVGAAELRARQCGGCRLTLNASDLSQIAAAPADEVLRCEECGRILVRTPESGL